MSDSPFVSIVMTYYERYQQVRNTLRSFQAHGYTNFEVVIVDDGSSKNPISSNTFNDFNFPITVINMPVTKTYSNPCVPFNVGFDKAKGDIVIIQNAECLHLDNILDYTRSSINEGCYLTFSCYSINREKSQKLNKLINWDIGYLNTLVTVDRIVSQDGDDGWYNHSIHRPCAYHFTSAITKKNLTDLGGFDLRYSSGMCFDDDELLNRISKKGLNIKIVDEKRVIHQWHYTMGESRNFNTLFGRNMFLYHFVTKKEKLNIPNKLTIRYLCYKLFRPFMGIGYTIWKKISLTR